MRPSALAFAALVAALPAAAQQQAGPVAPDVGFFRPQPNGDVSLTHTLAPEAYQPIQRPAAPPATQTPAAPQAPAAPAASNAPLVVVVPDTTRRGEDQMDRSREEAALANAAAARQPRINGAFTGLTDERDR